MLLASLLGLGVAAFNVGGNRSMVIGVLSGGCVASGPDLKDCIALAMSWVWVGAGGEGP